MCRVSQNEVMAQHGCEVWGLSRSLGSYIASFLNDEFKIKQEDWFSKQERQARAVSYTDVGLVLITSRRYPSDRLTYYVANPISRECVEIPPPPSNVLEVAFFRPSGLATRVENGVVIGYKVVLMRTRNIRDSNVGELLMYSSETGLWSFKTLYSPLPLSRLVHSDPVSLNGNLYWLGCRCLYGSKEVVVSHDFYAESDQYRVVLFPDSEKEPNFSRACSASQGFLMYMNADKNDASLEHNLRVWRLKDGEWQLLSEISLSCIKTRFDYYPLAINPFDANTMYLQSNLHSCLASTNLHKGKFGLHNNLERTSDGRFLSFAEDWESQFVINTTMEGFDASFAPFLLPRWLHRIPSPPS